MKKNEIRKMVTAAMLIAIAVALSPFSIPIAGAKCFPTQHFINVLSAVFLGPVYAVGVAFSTSLIRNLMGAGTLLAFPGSMIGALLCGLAYRYSKKVVPTCLAEVFGTGVLGGILAYPVATLLMGRGDLAIFTFVVPFLISTAGGSLIAAFLLFALFETGLMQYLHRQMQI